MKILLMLAAGLAAVYALILIFARFFAHIIIFPAPAPTYFAGSENVFFKLDDGTEITGLYLPADNSKYCVIYSHGNGEDLGMIEPILRTFQAAGVSVLGYDYVGYGLSKGKPSEEKLYESADAAWKYATEVLKFAEKNIVLFGYSLGSAPATHLAAKHPGARALIISGGVAKGVYTILPWNIVPWDILNNVSRIEKTKAPILFLHGTRDRIVPPRNARMNFAAAKSPARLVWLDDTGHLELSESDGYWTEILNFIKTPTDEKSTGNIVR